MKETKFSFISFGTLNFTFITLKMKYLMLLFKFIPHFSIDKIFFYVEVITDGATTELLYNGMQEGAFIIVQAIVYIS